MLRDGVQNLDSSINRQTVRGAVQSSGSLKEILFRIRALLTDKSYMVLFKIRALLTDKSLFRIRALLTDKYHIVLFRIQALH